MLLEPRPDVRLLVRPVVVHHQVQLQFLGKFPVQPAQKFQPLLMAMPGVTLANHLAVQHVQRRKKRRRAVALVVVSHRAAPAFLERQSRLGPIPALNLAFSPHPPAPPSRGDLLKPPPPRHLLQNFTLLKPLKPPPLGGLRGWIWPPPPLPLFPFLSSPPPNPTPPPPPPLGRLL